MTFYQKYFVFVFEATHATPRRTLVGPPLGCSRKAVIVLRPFASWRGGVSGANEVS